MQFGVKFKLCCKIIKGTCDDHVPLSNCNIRNILFNSKNVPVLLLENILVTFLICKLVPATLIYLMFQSQFKISTPGKIRFWN